MTNHTDNWSVLLLTLSRERHHTSEPEILPLSTPAGQLTAGLNWLFGYLTEKALGLTYRYTPRLRPMNEHPHPCWTCALRSTLGQARKFECIAQTANE